MKCVWEVLGRPRGNPWGCFLCLFQTFPQALRRSFAQIRLLHLGLVADQAYVAETTCSISSFFNQLRYLRYGGICIAKMCFS